MIGKSGAYLVLPTFADDAIVRISTPGIASGASGAVTFNVFDGETAVSTQVTGCTEDHAFNISPKKKNIAYKIKVTNANNVRFSKIKIWLGEPDAATAVDNTDAEVKAVKTIVNGQLFIEKNGKVYNILGTLVK